MIGKFIVDQLSSNSTLTLALLIIKQTQQYLHGLFF